MAVGESIEWYARVREAYATDYKGGLEGIVGIDVETQVGVRFVGEFTPSNESASAFQRDSFLLRSRSGLAGKLCQAAIADAFGGEDGTGQGLGFGDDFPELRRSGEDLAEFVLVVGFEPAGRDRASEVFFGDDGALAQADDLVNDVFGAQAFGDAVDRCEQDFARRGRDANSDGAFGANVGAGLVGVGGFDEGDHDSRGEFGLRFAEAGEFA